MTLDAASRTLSPLPGVLSHGLIAVSIFGLLSFLCSISLFLLLTYRLIKWRWMTAPKRPMNQFLLLIYNLLLADIQQAIAFLLNIDHLRTNSIEVGTTACFAQGWFISTGDLASSIFICAIACHTFLGVVKDYRLPTTAFYCVIASLWAFIYIMAALGPLMHGREVFARASAWCWINDMYQNDRLWLHYLWIFICMFSTFLIYTFIVLFLRRRVASQALSAVSNAHGATPLMILYPFIYIVCTAPLAAGRISALAGHDVSLAYFCASGSLIACNGWLDALLYASTRADIVLTEMPPGEEVGLETFAFMGKGQRFGNVTTVQAGDGRGNRLAGRRSHGSDSEENLYGLGRIGVKGEVTVSVDVIPNGMTPKHPGAESLSWDGTSSRKSSQTEN